MTPEQQLRAALESRASTASPNPGALAEIRSRADRRRWTARLQVGVASVAVVGIAAGAFALADGRDRLEPAPPAASESPDPTPEPSVVASTPASPTPSATPSTTPPPSTGPVGRDEFVAFLQDGRLTVVSAATGRIARTVATIDRSQSGQSAEVELSPDRRTVYVVTHPNDGCGGTIRSYDVETGAARIVASGSRVAVSPDGRRLAYVENCDDPMAVEVRDLVTGTTRRYTHSMSERAPSGEPEPWGLVDLTWHADGKRIWLAMDWENMTHLRLLDPASDRTTADAERVFTEHVTRSLERRGTGLLFPHHCCYPEFTEDWLIVLRDSSGRERVLVRSPTGDPLREPQAGPDGDLLYTKGGRLYRMDVETGQTTDLGASTAIARDW